MSAHEGSAYQDQHLRPAEGSDAIANALDAVERRAAERLELAKLEMTESANRDLAAAAARAADPEPWERGDSAPVDPMTLMTLVMMDSAEQVAAFEAYRAETAAYLTAEREHKAETEAANAKLLAKRAPWSAALARLNRTLLPKG